jgi:uncharacterized membrane protein YgcG
MVDIVRCSECGREMEKSFERSSYWESRKPLCRDCEAKRRIEEDTTTAESLIGGVIGGALASQVLSESAEPSYESNVSESPALDVGGGGFEGGGGESGGGGASGDF